ncbi:MAG: type II toxin-antitoxin system ParD family antitoxin [Thermofilaceae archaeon]
MVNVVNRGGPTAVVTEGREELRARLPRRRGGGRRTRPVTVTLPFVYVQMLDRLVEVGLFENRSEAVRFAILLLLQFHRATVAGTVVGYR